MAARNGSGFDPSRGRRRAASAGFRTRKSGGFILRFTAIVAVGTAMLWLIDQPVPAAKIRADSVPSQQGVGAG